MCGEGSLLFSGPCGIGQADRTIFDGGPGPKHGRANIDVGAFMPHAINVGVEIEYGTEGLAGLRLIFERFMGFVNLRLEAGEERGADDFSFGCVTGEKPFAPGL